MQTPEEHIANQALIMFGEIHAQWVAFDGGADALIIIENILKISQEAFKTVSKEN